MNKELPNKFTFTYDEEKYSAELIHGEYCVTLGELKRKLNGQ